MIAYSFTVQSQSYVCLLLQALAISLFTWFIFKITCLTYIWQIYVIDLMNIFFKKYCFSSGLWSEWTWFLKEICKTMSFLNFILGNLSVGLMHFHRWGYIKTAVSTVGEYRYLKKIKQKRIRKSYQSSGCPNMSSRWGFMENTCWELPEI